MQVEEVEVLGGIFKGANGEEVLELFHWVADNCIVKSLHNDVFEYIRQQ